MAIAAEKQLTLGVDTHLNKHVSVLINRLGQIVSTSEFETTSKGYHNMLRWCKSFGNLQQAGVEGTGTYGAGLYRYLDQHNIPVFEVTRPNRIKRRQKGKTDTLDAENAARKLLTDGIPPNEVADNLGVSVPTLYRWLPASLHN